MAGELISREALERIVHRAAELQTGERDIGDGLTEPELLALGQDVGIPARYLKQALLEERTRLLDEPTGRALAGPAQLAAQRVVPGDRGGRTGAVALMEDRAAPGQAAVSLTARRGAAGGVLRFDAAGVQGRRQTTT
jgi:hypothetical protein